MADWTAVGLTYQGFFFQTLGNKAAPVTMKRMELRHPNPANWPPQAQLNEGLPAAALLYPGSYKYWAASGVTTFTCQDCYLNYYPEFATQAFATKFNTKTKTWDQVNLQTGGAQNFVGGVVKGAPTQEFVPANSVGIGYK